MKHRLLLILIVAGVGLTQRVASAEPLAPSAQEASAGATFAQAETADFNPLLGVIPGDGFNVRGDVLQLYGLFNPAISYLSASGTPRGGNAPSLTSFASTGSYWGLRGAEDLGRGWQVLFQLENTFNVGTGTNTSSSGAFSGRDTFVGFQSDDFGVIKLGYLSTPLGNTSSIFKFIGDQLPVATPTTLMTTLNGTSLDFSSRVANAVLYATSKGSDGLVGHFLYSRTQADDGGLGVRTGVYSLAGSYGDGPLYVEFAHESRANQDKLAQGQSTDWDNRVVMRYAFTSTFKLALGIDYAGSEGTYGKKAASSPGRITRSAATASLAKAFGNQEVIATYAYAHALQCSGGAVAGAANCNPGVVGGTGAQQVSLVYEVFLSKRTALSSYISRIWNHRAGLYDFDAVPLVQSVSARAPGADPIGIGVGMTHIF
ncbi:porin [Pandoraea anhela]|uniref:Porin n=1 Tax=Pandoraea anhela TaxID=2508295 RepID=A0A5E4WAW9_9BURK|nr:porin [Pandoraea anhela]VVE21728.1 porin [Pandoraea anhela]